MTDNADDRDPVPFSRGLDGDTLRRLLSLSGIRADSVDLTTLAPQLDRIIGYFGLLSELAEPDAPTETREPIDADSLRSGPAAVPLGPEDLTRLSSAFSEGYFRVPRVLGGDR